MKIVCVFIIFAVIVGCGGKVIYLDPGDAVRLRQDVKNVKVWVKTKDGEIIPTKTDLKEGGFYMMLTGDDLKPPESH